MRFLITLKPVIDRQPLLFNYQYPFMSWIYGRLRDADQEYAQYLHQNGYPVANSLKSFKHFTFSNFIIPRHVIRKIQPGDHCMWLTPEPIQVIVSFFIEKAAQNFIIGLFNEQRLRLFNQQYQAEFVVERVETLPEITLGNSIQLKTLSPMLIGKTRRDGSTEYLSPKDPDFAAFFAFNLTEKYKSLYPDSISLDLHSSAQLIHFKLLRHDKMKSRLIHIKEDKENETEVRSFTDFSFELSGPEEMLRVGYYGGFGKNSANGLGCCDILS